MFSQPSGGATPAHGEISEFQLVTPAFGWSLSSDQHLFITENFGRQWRDATPPVSGPIELLGAFFFDANTGWMILRARSTNTRQLQVALTTDAGRTWSIQPFQNAQSSHQFDRLPRRAFIHFTDPMRGWIVVKLRTTNKFSVGRLFRTSDGGRSWSELPEPPIGDPAYFASPNDGWMAGGPAGDELYATHDAGQTWQPQDLPSLPSTEWRPAFGLPVFRDASQGTLPVLIPSSSGSTIAVYSTLDGGQRWQLRASYALGDQVRPGRLIVPLSPMSERFVTADLNADGLALRTEDGESGPVAVPVWPGAHVRQLAFVTPQRGWVLTAAGRCLGASKTNCETQSTLLATTDEGKTFSDITPLDRPPTVDTADDTALALSPRIQGGPAPTAELGQAASGVQSFVYNTQLSSNRGFDYFSTLPSDALIQWMRDPTFPYTDIGVYLTGAVNHTPAGPTATWLTEVAGAGWGILPLWFGPQVTCAVCPRCLDTSINSTNAAQRGVAEADSAMSAARAIGLNSNIGLNSTIIYYDFEPYGSSCRQAAASFVVAWAQELHRYGFSAGLYANALALTGLNQDITATSSKPDAVWISSWQCDDGDPCEEHDPSSVWDINNLDNGLWSLNQRIRQYTGDAYDKFTGLDKVDKDISGGPVVRTSAALGVPVAVSDLVIKAMPSGAIVTPSSGAFALGQTLAAEFTIKNEGLLNACNAPVSLPVVTVGGRLNGDNTCAGGCPDFTHVSMTLADGQSRKYFGTITLDRYGTYSFFPAYQLPNGTWNGTWNGTIPTDPGVVTTATVSVAGGACLVPLMSRTFAEGMANAGVTCPVSPPLPPSPVSPGSTDANASIATTTPTMVWTAGTAADALGVYISRYPYGSSNLVYVNQSISGSQTAITVPSGYLADGGLYRWNMSAHNSAGWGSVSNTLYFQVTLPSPIETISTPAVGGPTAGTVGTAFTLGLSATSVSSLGHQIQYQFDWGNGTLSGWLPVGLTSATVVWPTAGTYSVRVQARCATDTTVVSSPSAVFFVYVTSTPPESISVPGTPSGPSSGFTSTAYSYSTSGASSSFGHPLQYQFSFGNGDITPWMSPGVAANEAWFSPGTYPVTVKARCAIDNQVVSQVSGTLYVMISNPGIQETISTINAPTGESLATVGAGYRYYFAGGGTSNLGHAVQYQFYWGDGTSSGWLTPGTEFADKIWTTQGNVSVTIQARCSIHTNILSTVSVAFPVSVTSPSGSVTLLANGLSSPLSLAVDASHVYWTDSGSGRVLSIPSDGSTHSPTVLASSMVNPAGVALDDTYVYFSEGSTNNSTIRKVPKAGGTVSIIQAGLTSVFRIASDANNLYWTIAVQISGLTAGRS